MKADLLHGGALDRMRKVFPDAPEPWLDLSTGINPWPYPIEPIAADAFHHLPTDNAITSCREAMARAFGAPASRVLPAPGSELLIRLLPTILKPQTIAIAQPTYGDHAQSWHAAGCQIVETPDPLDSINAVDGVVLCNPNNPDGRTWSVDRIENARLTLAERNGWMIVDEAYADLHPDRSVARQDDCRGLIVLRSFGKFYGLAGVRLGALIGPEAVLSAMRARLGVWSVSGPALDLGVRAYRDYGWQDQTRNRLAAARTNLDHVLHAAGLNVTGGTDLYRYLEVEDAHAIWQRLAEHGIYVRRFAWSPRHLRIGLPTTAADVARLDQAVNTL